MSVGIVLMSRAPIPGKTKTRLQTHLTAKECAQLHRAFLEDISRMLLRVAQQKDNIQLYLSYTPQGTKDQFRGIIPDEFKMFTQKGANLGEKMYNSLQYAYQQGDDRQIIMGSDLPSLQPQVILRAIEALQKKDIVIGPSTDGGYYLLGNKQPHSFLFAGILWGESSVFQATIEAIKSRDHLEYSLVDKCYDIDIYSELLKLRAELRDKESWESYPQKTAQVVRNILGDKRGEDYLCQITN